MNKNPNTAEVSKYPVLSTNHASAASCILYYSDMNNCLYFGLIKMLNLYSIAWTQNWRRSCFHPDKTDSVCATNSSASSHLLKTLTASSYGVVRSSSFVALGKPLIYYLIPYIPLFAISIIGAVVISRIQKNVHDLEDERQDLLDKLDVLEERMAKIKIDIAKSESNVWLSKKRWLLLLTPKMRDTHVQR